MVARAPDGQQMKFDAPIVKPGKQFPVAYTPGGRGGAPPVDTALMLAMDTVLCKFEISHKKATDLLVLKDYDIILIVDDSGSMRRKDLGCTGTRWEELRETMALIISIAGCFDKDGLDIYFLNRPKITNVATPEDSHFLQGMQDLPYGQTPLLKRLVDVVRDREAAARMDSSLLAKPVMLMIFTDGVPDGGPEAFGNTLRGVLRRSTTNLEFRCQIMACTGVDNDIAWLNKLDEELDELDVTDDYVSEKKQAEGVFTRGDWCMKAMLGAVNSAYDKMDETREQKRRRKSSPPRSDTGKPQGAASPIGEPRDVEAGKTQLNWFPKWILTMACLAGSIYVAYTLKNFEPDSGN